MMQPGLGVSLRAACYAQRRAEPEGVSAHSGNARSRITQGRRRCPSLRALPSRAPRGPEEYARLAALTFIRCAMKKPARDADDELPTLFSLLDA
jgi:hypothetical protein